MTRRLFLVGDDPALDAIAELSRHLDYFEVSRLDEPPEAPLGPGDHLLVGCGDRNRAQALLDRARAAGLPGFSALVPDEPSGSDGARAIVAAAQLVTSPYCNPDHKAKNKNV